MITSRPTGGSGDSYGVPASGAMPLPVLKAPSMPGRAPGGQAPAANAYNGQSTWNAPQQISADSTQSAMNNRIGQAHMMGDQRIFQKQFARNGLGASKGTDYFAQVGQQQALSQGRADAAGIAAQDQANNAKARLDFQYGREREAQALAMVQHALSQSGWAQQFAQQEAAAKIAAAHQNAYINFFR